MTETDRTAFHFGTKAETLTHLRAYNTRFYVPPFIYFTHAEWDDNRQTVLDKIQEAFPGKNQTVAVRSSAIKEDGSGHTHAGAYDSILNVPISDIAGLANSIEKVLASYGEEADPLNQILVQEMVCDVAVSGVIMNFDVDDGSPYYVIGYDDNSGRTDTITGGTGEHKSVFIHRNAGAANIKSPRVCSMLSLARDVESILGIQPMNIEFAIDKNNEASVFQVRRITTIDNWRDNIDGMVTRCLNHLATQIDSLNEPRSKLVGERTILTKMSDWNPAEIIGPTPRPLATSLYRDLITNSIWAEARNFMGYRPVKNQELMVILAGHPYIDVRCSLNSLLPRGLSSDLAARLVDASIKRLAANPHLHDKLEFDVCITTLDPAFDENFSRIYGDLVPESGKKEFRKCLLKVTEAMFSNAKSAPLVWSLSTVSSLNERNKTGVNVLAGHLGGISLLSHLRDILDEAKRLGTFPFSVLARCAFIAEAFLKAFIQKDAMKVERVEAFKNGVRTIAGELAHDLMQVENAKMSLDEFKGRFGHLRPNSYDILSPRYADRPELFHSVSKMSGHEDKQPFEPSDKEKAALNGLFRECGLTSLDAEGFFSFAERAIAGREFGKYVFTRNLSDALESLALWGEHLDLNRDNLSFLTLNQILDTMIMIPTSDARKYFHDLADRGREAWDLTRTVKLSYILREANDIYVVPVHRSKPSFITRKVMEGSVQLIEPDGLYPGDISGKIVCIRSADPGFDWIFTKGIGGLITLYGGTNSHMAVRCAEFGLPAAIGIGDLKFDEVLKAQIVMIDGAHQNIRVVK